MKDDLAKDATQELVAVKRNSNLEQPVVDTPLPLSVTTRVVEYPIRKSISSKESRAIPISKRELKNAQLVRERCRQLCISVFFREHAPVRTMGFTSPINGDGKSFLSRVTAGILANDSNAPVVLVECNWEQPNLHKHFGLPLEPGLAEWIRGTCNEADIRHEVGPNLTVIPAGNGRYDTVKLLQKVQQRGLHTTLAHSDELLVVDLPAIVTSSYGRLAASLVESLFIVVQSGTTTNVQMAETCTQLKDLPVEGIILNQLENRIPNWIRQLL